MDRYEHHSMQFESEFENVICRMSSIFSARNVFQSVVWRD